MWNIFLFGLALTYFSVMGFSRVLLGVHSLNQIIYGWTLGIWIAFVCHYIF